MIPNHKYFTRHKEEKKNYNKIYDNETKFKSYLLRL